MRPHNLQQPIRQQPINNRAHTQRYDIDRRVRIQVIQAQDLLARRDGALAVGQALLRVAGEDDVAQGVGRQVADRVADGREEVDALEEVRHVD